MSLPLLALVVAVALGLGYVLYGRFLGRVYALDDATPTPAHEKNDGVDFSPTSRGYLLGQHFSAIAAAGPIVGPIVACQQFGWLPCVLWIVFGCVLIGAVHDMSALVASVRHGARTVAEVVRQNLSPRAWAAFMAFIWLALLYVIVAFTDVTASTFLGKVEELAGERRFDAGGAVAFASVAYLSLALVMGLVQRRFSPPLWLVTAIFVPAALGVVWLGTQASTIFVLPAGVSPQKLWGVLILAYCFVASLLPVWLLMQPRGYLGGFVLYVVLAVGVIGVLSGQFEVQQPAFKGWTQVDAAGATTPTGLLFPFLFVTIACGACSGFHGLVCSGTTSKQVDKEGDCRAVGFGGMLLEGFVALIALSTIMIVAAPSGGAGAIYGQGIGQYLTVIIGEEHRLFAVTFGAMAFSTFVFDTLDVATRLGRYILEELFDLRGRVGAALATGATLGLPLLFVLTADAPGPGRPASSMAYWTLFGASNQLLAGLTLLGVTVWLRRTGRPIWFTLGPTAFILTITVWALGRLAWTGLSGAGGSVSGLANGLVSCVLLALAGFLVFEAAGALLRAPGGMNREAPAAV